jgi:Spy/CpxP family protein refolding chaperone
MRSTTRLRTGILGTALAASLVASPLLAGPGGGHRRGGPLRGALEQLDLSQEQKDKVRTVLEGEKDRFQTLREQMRLDHNALKLALDATPQDPTAVGKAFLKIHANRETMKAERQRVLSEVRGLLTADQRSRLDGYMAAVRDRFPGRGMARGQGRARDLDQR